MNIGETILQPYLDNYMQLTSALVFVWAEGNFLQHALIHVMSSRACLNMWKFADISLPW